MDMIASQRFLLAPIALWQSAFCRTHRLLLEVTLDVNILAELSFQHSCRQAGL